MRIKYAVFAGNNDAEGVFDQMIGYLLNSQDGGIIRNLDYSGARSGPADIRSFSGKETLKKILEGMGASSSSFVFRAEVMEPEKLMFDAENFIKRYDGMKFETYVDLKLMWFKESL